MGVRTAAILVLFGVAFVGTMMLWFMRPTASFRNEWTPKIRADLDSTYFGRPGSSILLYVFPVLFMSVLGTIFLHFESKKDSGNTVTPRKEQKTGFVSLMKRPVLVKGRLGIVSATELLFFLMFLSLLIWTFSHYLKNYFAAIKLHDDEKMWEAKLERVGLALGLVGNVCFGLLFYPVTRASSILPVVGLTSESSVKYHIWVGHIVMFLFTLHGCCFIIYWISTDHISEIIKWGKDDVSNVAGMITLIVGLIMWITSITSIRRKLFELFYYTHNLYFLFIFFYIMHTGISFFYTVLPGVYLFLLDRYLRFLQSRQNVQLLSARTSSSHLVELNFSKHPGLLYAPTSVLFINVASISKLQWHPFTVSSCCQMEPNIISVVLKNEGSWTNKLCEMLSSKTPLDHLDISVEGPYGPPSISHLLRHDTLVLVSGGSGITSFFSIIKDLIFRSSVQKSEVPKVLLICAFKSSSDLGLLNFLPLSTGLTNFSSIDFQVESFITRETQPSTEAADARTIVFKPIPQSVPLTSILGPNMWLWLGGIISSSFIIFLILLGIVTRYHMYPIDSSTKQGYPVPWRALFNILFICFSIVGVCSLAALWNKYQNSFRPKMFQVAGASTPDMSRGTTMNEFEQELESFPLQSLHHITNVHYGARPDLIKYILGREGSSVGVLVSGPKKMRQEVANICKSGLKENLHFESISFTW